MIKGSKRESSLKAAHFGAPQEITTQPNHFIPPLINRRDGNEPNLRYR